MNADILKVRTPAELYLSEAFASAKALLPGNKDVAKWRDDSFGVFSASGLPHRRVESWHYTDLRTLMREGLPLAHPPARAARDALRKQLASAPVSKHRLVLVDGYFVPELSEGLPQGLKIRSLSSVLAEGRPDLIAQLSSQDFAVQDSIVSLNAALMQDGVVVEVEPGTVIAEPVHLIHVSASLAPAACFSRSALIVGACASIHLAESYQPANGHAGQTNACLIISLGDGAVLSHTVALTGSAPRNLHIESVMAQIGAGAKFKSVALVSGIGLMRRQM
ncbi:MAG: hypothetical protein L0Z53_20595, partial [Acidobacteriales bacterium]|nr:hypothetical protein [Terriglobales bacterium]